MNVFVGTNNILLLCRLNDYSKFLLLVFTPKTTITSKVENKLNEIFILKII